MLLVAVSGGIDSMCLAEKVRLEGGPFAIAHCNFGLRGEESDGDEAFVKEWAQKYDIPIHVKRFETEACAAREGISIEMAARRLRYHWFGELCREHGYEAVAVAHNANDNAETLILNLLRGTGPKGITGMKAQGTIPDPDFTDIPLLRPLLGMTREEIEAFAAEHGLSWREDRTNACNDFKRNKIRNQVFPLFKEINPSFIQTLNSDMERFNEAISCGAMALLGAHQSARPYPGLCGSKVIEGEKAAGDNRGQSPLIGGGGEGSGRYTSSERAEYNVTEEVWDGSKEVKQPEGILIVDADKAGELTEGHWETGDWIRPLGAPGKKKLQDWFTDHHIPADEKPFVTLYKSAQDPHHVLAIAGWCIDHSVRVTASTRRILRISEKKS
jgi:tRNA(Ile)-lysidine synthase